MKSVFLVAILLASSNVYATTCNGRDSCSDTNTYTYTTNANLNSNSNYNKNTSTANSSSYSKTGDNVNVNIYNEAEIPTETTSNINYSGKVELKNVPNVNAPALTSSGDACMGSASGGASGSGFGISFGSTKIDKNCVMLKNSRELWNMGFRQAAVARMCMDSDNRKALESTGWMCPAEEKKKGAWED